MLSNITDFSMAIDVASMLLEYRGIDIDVLEDVDLKDDLYLQLRILHSLLMLPKEIVKVSISKDDFKGVENLIRTNPKLKLIAASGARHIATLETINESECKILIYELPQIDIGNQDIDSILKIVYQFIIESNIDVVEEENVNFHDKDTIHLHILSEIMQLSEKIDKAVIKKMAKDFDFEEMLRSSDNAELVMSASSAYIAAILKENERTCAVILKPLA